MPRAATATGLRKLAGPKHSTGQPSGHLDLKGVDISLAGGWIEVATSSTHQQGLSNMLRNPAYAGIYAYGRSRTDPSRRLPGR